MTSVLQPHGIIGRPGHHVRGARGHDLVAAGASVVLLGRGAGDLPDEPVAIGVRLATLTAQGVQRPLVITVIGDAAVLAPHD